MAENQAGPQMAITIEAGNAGGRYFKDMWRYRELLYFLALREFLIRYKQTALGVLWSVLRPVITMIVFTVVFGKLAKLPPDGAAPYPLMVLAAMLPWQFFASALADSSASVVSNSNLITKVYFPRLIIPLGAVIVSMVDFFISLAITAALMGWYGFAPDAKIIALPFFSAMAFFLALGAGLWFAALNVKYRDFRYIIPFAVQFGLFISPVGFSSSIVPEKWRVIYSLNPMAGVIDGFRWALLGGQAELYWQGILLSLAVTAALVASGVYYFLHTERTFADVI